MNSIYQWSRIIAFCSLFLPISPYSAFALAPDGRACDKPTDLTVSSVTESGATLEWIGQIAGSYEVELRSKGRTPNLKRVLETPANFLAVDGLIPGSQYKFRVTGDCGADGSSGSSRWHVFMTAGMNPDESCPKASDLHVVQSTMTSATLAWSGAPFSTHFEVEVRSKGDTPTYFFEKSLADTTVTIFGLTPMGHYQFRVRSSCENTAVSGSTSWKSFEPGEMDSDDMCETIAQITLDSVSDSQASLVWESMDESSAFVVYVSDGSDYDTAFAEVVSPFVLTGLMPGTEYQVQLEVTCAVGQSTMINASFETLKMDTIECSAPDGLRAVPADSTFFILDWDTIETAISYHIQVATIDSISDLLVNTTVASVGYQFAQVDSISSFRFRVQSICEEGDSSAFSAWSSFPIASDSIQLACEMASNIQVDSMLGNNAFLSWMGPESAAYQIEVRTEDTLWSFVLMSDSLRTSLALFDLDSFTDYSLRVRSICGRERSEYSDPVTFSTTDVVALCQAPSDLDANMIDDSTALLTWARKDSASYQVEVSRVDTGVVAVLTLDVEDTTTSVSGLSAEVEYHFRVRSICSEGDTSDFADWFDFVLADTMANVCEEVPTAFAVDSIGSDFALLSWDGPTDVGFRIFLQNIDTVSEVVEYYTEAYFVYTDSLMPATNYEAVIQTVCADSESEISERLSFTTNDIDTLPVDTCATPTAIILDSVDTYDAWISWIGPDSVLYVVNLISADDESLDTNLVVGDASIYLQDLMADHSYSIRVRALCSEQDSSLWSEDFPFQTLEAPEEPTDTCAAPIGEVLAVNSETASISWTRSSDSAFYLLEVENIGLTSSYRLITTTRDTNFIIDGLMPGGHYQWKVAGFCDGGSFSDCSPWMTFTTESSAEDTCMAPVNLAATLLDGGALLAWSGSPGDLDYEVEVQSLDTTSFYGQSSIVFSNELEISGLEVPGSYQFKVNVQCPNGKISEDSEWFIFDSMNEVDSAGIHTARVKNTNLAFPNPVQSVMNVKVPDMNLDGEIYVELSDLMGRSVLREKHQNLNVAELLQFEVSSLREGIYKLSVRSSSDQFNEMIYIHK